MGCVATPCMSQDMKQHFEKRVGMTSYLKETISPPEGKEARDSQRGDYQGWVGLRVGQK